HWPDSSKELRPVLEAMKKLIDDGKIKSFGVSNFTAAHIEKAYSLSKSIGVHPVINQVEFHPGLYQKELQEYCKDKDIMLTAYSPLGRGRSIEYDIFQELAEKYNKTKSQIALRWALDRDVVVIPKSSSKEHIQENLEIFDFTLDDEDASAIDSLGDDQRILDPGFAEFDRKDVFEKD
ncbi:MAG: aldo/keto reductase, partial [Candidatus Woesearchaeota archaeon]